MLLVVTTASAQSTGAVRNPRPVAIDAQEVFRVPFSNVVSQRHPEWQLQPRRPLGPAPSGHPPLEYEELRWRRATDKLDPIRIRYSRYATVKEASLALRLHVETVPVPHRTVSFADEAYEPSYFHGGGHLWFRRGTYVFILGVDADVPTVKANTVLVMPNPSLPLAREFLAAADRVLSGQPATR
jgi:hypothetical protein